jgi:hypothetical protein
VTECSYLSEAEMEVRETVEMVEIERILIIWNMLGRDIDGTEPCQRYHRQCRIILEGTYLT